MLPVLAGLVFAIAVGGLMRLPGKETLLDANAANLSVMASLWLGALLAKGVQRAPLLSELGVALITYACAAAAFQGQAAFLFVGFAIQTVWAIAHLNNRIGVSVRSFYPPFAAAVCLGFAAMHLMMERLT